jgi:hypothetical protein
MHTDVNMIIRIMKMLSRIMVSPPVFHFVPIALNLAKAVRHTYVRDYLDLCICLD